MKITLQASVLQEAIQKAFSVIPTKAVLQQLEGMELKIADEVFSIRSTDLECQFAQNVCEVKKSKESVLFTIHGAKFTGLVNSIPAEEEIKLDFTDTKLTLAMLNSKYNFTAQKDNELPNLAHDFKSKASFEITADKLIKLIENTIFAINSGTQGFAMSGISVRASNGQLAFCGTNNQILSKSTVKVNKKLEADIIIPPKIATLILKSFTNESLTVSFNESLIKIESESICLYSRLLGEVQSFPQYESLLAKIKHDKQLICNRTDLLGALKRIDVFSDFKTKAVNIEFQTNAIVLSVADNQTASDGAESVAAKYSGENFSIILNGKYLLSILSKIDSDEVRISFSDTKPVIIEPLEQTEPTFFSFVSQIKP